MKKFFKKTTATSLFVFGILSAMPSALCAPNITNDITDRQDIKHIDRYNIMVVGKYLDSFQDICKLSMVNKKKYKDILERYHFNPVKITSRDQLAFFPGIETYYIRKCERDYIPTPKDGIKEIVCLPGSFNSSQFGEVLRKNEVVNERNKCIGNWKREFELNDENPMDGCRVTFTDNGKAIVFMFDPYFDRNFNIHSHNVFATKLKIENYNKFLKECGVEEAIIPLSGKIVISDNVTIIGDGAFENCYDLKSIKIPKYVTHIGESAFLFCRSLLEAIIPDSVTSIGDNAFYGCEFLTTVNIPNSIKSIGDSVFGGCESLVSIKIPESVESIGDYAFCGCKSLKSINIPSSVKTIGQGAFCSCKSLVSVSIAGSIESIGESAFYDCEYLTTVSISNSIKSISEDVFRGCKNLECIKYNGKTYDNVDDFVRDVNSDRNG